MRTINKLTLILLTLSLGLPTFSAETKVDRARLNQLSIRLQAEQAQAQSIRYKQLKNIKTGPMGILNSDPNIELVGLFPDGRPLIFHLENIVAAATIGTNHVWPNADAGYNLNGDLTLHGDLAVWDGGAVRLTHDELSGRVIQQDGATSLVDHSTHVAGTMIGAGVDPDAIGMSHEGELDAYDWNSDTIEMTTAAGNGLRISSHSYGYITGWYYNSGSDLWYWYGNTDLSETEDYGFGYYSSAARNYDQIAYDAPNYLIFKSAGNDRNDDPGPDQGHYYWDNGWVWSTLTRPADGGADGYDCISYVGTAKNIITVGAIDDIPAGYNAPEDVVMSSFSGWGPTDDGRIKPDLVANGIGLYSPLGWADDAYASWNGTSMATPSLAGSANLLYEHYGNTHGDTIPLSSTIKAVLIHTADEAGDADGPDYHNGWGLANIRAAAELIEDDSSSTWRMQELELANGGTFSVELESAGDDPITVSIVWTDLEGVVPVLAVNPTDIMLVNDLDLTVTEDETGTIYQSWLLDPDNPSFAATTGDNDVDNVEKVQIAAPAAGTYTVAVTHDGVIANGPQAFSLIITGIAPHQDPIPIPTPEDLAATLNPVTGEVELSWAALPDVLENDLDDLIEYQLLRDGELVGSTTETSMVHVLDGFDSYAFTLLAVYDEGLSDPSDITNVTWDERLPLPTHFVPISPTGLYHEFEFTSLSFEGMDLVEGDELGLYDGELCVGAIRLGQGDVAPFTFATWGANDGEPGFTVGNDITIKLWSTMDPIEFEIEVNTFDGFTGDALFAESGSSDAEIAFVTTPSLFEFVSPEVDEIVDHPIIDFTWRQSFDANPNDTITYLLFVAESVIFPVTLSMTTADTTGVDTLADDEDYIWFVLARDQRGDEGNSPPGAFSTYFPDPPEPFTLQSVEDESTVNAGEALLTWEESVDPDPEDIVTYSIYYSLDPDFANADSITGIEDESILFDPDIDQIINWRNQGDNRIRSDEDGEAPELDELPDDVTIYWKVRAQDSNSDGVWSTPAEGWSFSVYIIDAPSAPELVLPEMDELITTTDITFTWNSSFDPDPGDQLTYYLHVSDWPNMGIPLIEMETEETSLTIDSNLLPQGALYWTVMALDLFDQTAVSEIRSFVLDTPDLPSSFGLIEPMDGILLSVEDLSDLTFSWFASTDADTLDTLHYELVLNSLNEGIPLFHTSIILDDTTTTLNLLEELPFGSWEEELQLEWNVAVHSGLDSLLSNDTFNFNVEPYSSVDESVTLPTEFAIIAAYPNPFNSTIVIKYGLPHASQVHIQIFDLLGRELVGENLNQNAGIYEWNWQPDGSAGVYFFLLSNSQGETLQTKLLYLK